MKARFPLAKASSGGKSCSSCSKTEHSSGAAKEVGEDRGMPGVGSCRKRAQVQPKPRGEGTGYMVMAVMVMARLDGGWSPQKHLC